MPCNIVNFILELVIGGRAGTAVWGGQGRQEKERKKKMERKGKRKKERSKVKQLQRARKGVVGEGRVSVTTTRDSAMPSNVRSAQTLCRRGGSSEDGVRQQGGKEESKRAQRSKCCPFIGAFAHAQCLFAYIQFMPHVLPA